MPSSPSAELPLRLNIPPSAQSDCSPRCAMPGGAIPLRGGDLALISGAEAQRLTPSVPAPRRSAPRWGARRSSEPALSLPVGTWQASQPAHRPPWRLCAVREALHQADGARAPCHHRPDKGAAAHSIIDSQGASSGHRRAGLWRCSPARPR